MKTITKASIAIATASAALFVGHCIYNLNEIKNSINEYDRAYGSQVRSNILETKELLARIPDPALHIEAERQFEYVKKCLDEYFSTDTWLFNFSTHDRMCKLGQNAVDESMKARAKVASRLNAQPQDADKISKQRFEKFKTENEIYNDRIKLDLAKQRMGGKPKPDTVKKTVQKTRPMQRGPALGGRF